VKGSTSACKLACDQNTKERGVIQVGSCVDDTLAWEKKTMGRGGEYRWGDHDRRDAAGPRLAHVNLPATTILGGGEVNTGGGNTPDVAQLALD